jgi:hypothetical protein
MDDQLRYGGLHKSRNADAQAVQIAIELDQLFRVIRPTSLDSIYRLGVHRRDVEAEFHRHFPPGTPWINLDPSYLEQPSRGDWKRKAKEMASTLHHERTHIVVDDIVAAAREEEYLDQLAKNCGAVAGGFASQQPDEYKGEHLIARIPLCRSAARHVPPMTAGDDESIAAMLLERTAIEIAGAHGLDNIEELVARTHELEATGRQSPFRDPILKITADFTPDPSMHLNLLTTYFCEAEALERNDDVWRREGYLPLDGTDTAYARTFAEAALESYKPPSIELHAAVARLQELTDGFDLLSGGTLRF